MAQCQTGPALRPSLDSSLCGPWGTGSWIAATSFVHLRTHTEYAVVEGTLLIDALAAAAAAAGQPALAITDLSSLFVAVKFCNACRNVAVKPRIGVDVFVQPLAARSCPAACCCCWWRWRWWWCRTARATCTNLRRIKRFMPEQHFKTAAQKAELFADVLPSVQVNTMEIARRCSLMLVLGKPQLPDFSTPLVEAGAPAGRMPIEACFCKASHEGLEKRLVALFPNPAKREQDRPRCVERLQFELNTLVDMGFPGCFPSVSDFTVRAKENGCAVGPARGCGAGSRVACALPLRDPVAAVGNAAADEVSGHAAAAIAVPCASFSACAVSRRWHACSCGGIRPAMISGGDCYSETRRNTVVVASGRIIRSSMHTMSPMHLHESG